MLLTAANETWLHAQLWRLWLFYVILWLFYTYGILSLERFSMENLYILLFGFARDWEMWQRFRPQLHFERALFGPAQLFTNQGTGARALDLMF